MHIEELSDATYEALHEVWDKNGPRMEDNLRDPNTLDYLLFQDGGATQFHVVDGTPAVVVFGSIKEGLSATVMILNHQLAEVGQILSELKGRMEEWNLKRLTANVPGPVKDVQKALKELGFRREGHLRRATFHNGRLCGVDVYGMYRDQPRKRPQRVEVREEEVAVA